MGAKPVNSRGDTFNSIDLYKQIRENTSDPTKRGEMLFNWLTAGGLPHRVDPSQIFGQAQADAGVKSKAAAGQGIGGLFGFGNMIGDLQPVKPLSTAPLKAGVPYSVPAVPGMFGAPK